ncbi:MAG: hypothetical protein EOP05_02295 [Proteobacteria bacterium]|nr:MAG: hypothetical protein EOP05_02295 [Pseudomonadota bacterium]
MRFRRERRKLFRARFAVLTKSVLGPMLILSVVFDLVAHPKNWLATSSVRLILFLAAVLLSRSQKRISIARLGYFLPMHVLTFLMSITVCTVGQLSGYDSNVYLLRLNLVAILSFCFMPWSTVGLIISGTTIYLPFAIVAYLSPLITADLATHTHEIAAVLTTGLIGYFVNCTTVNDLRKSFERRLNLFKGGQEKDAIIDLKTRESIHLERLTTQFSQQVVSAIKSGAISIESSERREITVIFLDIENSAARAKILDASAFEAVLREFFGLVTNIFIKHNITIGTYLGDGLLAFSNAPNTSVDHQLRATRACLDLLERTALLKPHLDQLWRSNFNIRIGINSGVSTVGFFPNPEFGSYTAIGESVNLTARLCSSASPNSICMSKDFLRLVAPALRDIRVEPRGNLKDLKGFQDDAHETYSLFSSKKLGELDNCPRCGNRLTIMTDLETCHLLSCSGCGYSDVREKISLRSEKVLA